MKLTPDVRQSLKALFSEREPKLLERMGNMKTENKPDYILIQPNDFQI